ncbi:MAG: hypothetical protein U9Q69_04645 [Nanoarchaeota archaeon]|nr:hypothetical protein [Nanoarchaeota archaeon]
MKTWRDDVDPLIRKHLEILISDSVKQRKAYKKAANTANAQLWCAIAELSKRNFELEQENKLFKKALANISQKYKFLEKSLKDILPKKKKQKESTDPAQLLRDVLKKL